MSKSCARIIQDSICKSYGWKDKGIVLRVYCTWMLIHMSILLLVINLLNVGFM